MNRFLFLPLGALLASGLASGAHAQSINIPLPPPTPLSGGDITPAPGSGGTSAIVPTAMIALKPAAQYSDQELKAMGTGIGFPYELLQGVLKRYVDSKGGVYYLKARGDNDLATFVRAVAIVDLGQFPVFTTPVDVKNAAKGMMPDHSAELTFWINAYNGLRLQAIADRYPGISATQLKQLDAAKTQVVAGQTYSFAQLRQKIGGMDPRALFALMSGTKDGPSAPLSVYRYSSLNQLLTLAVQGFVNDQNKVSPPNRLSNSVEASPFLAEVDPYFKPRGSRRKNSGIREVLSTYTRSGSSRGYFATGDYTVNFSLGDNQLNEQIGR